jgi:hypothetical protein
MFLDVIRRVFENKDTSNDNWDILIVHRSTDKNNGDHSKRNLRQKSLLSISGYRNVNNIT